MTRRHLLRVVLYVSLCLSLSVWTTSSAGQVTDWDIVSRMDRLQHRTSDQGLDRPLSLAMALARAIKFNLMIEVERYNRFLAESNFDQANFSMLPKLTMTSTFSDRNNNPATEFNPDNQTATTQAQALLKWSILDFATGYIQKKQLKNATQASKERYRRTLNRIIAETRLMYFRAYYAQQRLHKAQALVQAIDNFNKKTQNESLAAVNDPLILLSFERDSLHLQQQLQRIEQNYLDARIQLAEYINTDRVKFTLDNTDIDYDVDMEVEVPVEQLIKAALYFRSELREHDYTVGDKRWQVTKSKWSWLPNLEFFAGPSFDDDEDLENNTWAKWGGSITVDLLSYISIPKKIESAQLDLTLEEYKQAAFSLLVAKEVRLATSRLPTAKKNYQLQARVADVEHKMANIRGSRALFGPEDEMERLRAEIQALLSVAAQDDAKLQLLGAYESLYLSLGVDFVTLEPEFMSLDEIEDHLKSNSLPKALTSYLAPMGWMEVRRDNI